MSNFDIGEVIHDRYEVLAILGEGGMGVVYKANDNLLSQVIALKTLLPAFAQHEEALTRFINEVKVSLKLNHQNIIRVYDIGRLGQLYYMTMQFIEGFSLFDWLKDNEKRDVGQVLDILKKICAGLEYAHRMGTFHRDIKPANIMMTNQGNVFVVDFGLAKLVDGMGNITRLGGAGTPNYMAPEQKRGGEIDQRSDIYALGVLGFEMLTGELPHLIDAKASKLNEKLNHRVDEVLDKSIAIDPEKRYGNILDFIQDLEEAIATRKVAPQQGHATVREADHTVMETAESTVIPEPKAPPSPESIVDMNMVTAGQFWMGSSLNETKNETEKPRHKVRLATYYIDKYAVTNQAYRKFMKETGHPEPPFWADPQFNNPTQPVVGVSWEDARAYAEWANKRLPTEAEWEKASKGEDGLVHPWGNEFNSGLANVDYVMARTSQVDQFPGGASPYGCLDMIGNVWEWCSDWFDENYYAMSPSENPEGPSKGDRKVIRGGAWDTISFNARNAFRFFSDPDVKPSNIGFRCVVDG